MAGFNFISLLAIPSLKAPMVKKYPSYAPVVSLVANQRAKTLSSIRPAFAKLRGIFPSIYKATYFQSMIKYLQVQNLQALDSCT
jgi:hypothetical protein